VVGSLTDIAELPIEFMANWFKEGRMGVIYFLNFLPLGFMFFHLGLFSTKFICFHFILDFGVKPMLVFKSNHLKSLN